jgi:hypothetical protein
MTTSVVKRSQWLVLQVHAAWALASAGGVATVVTAPLAVSTMSTLESPPRVTNAYLPSGVIAANRRS